MIKIKGLHEIALERFPHLWDLNKQAKYKLVYGDLDSIEFEDEGYQRDSYFMYSDCGGSRFMTYSIPSIDLPNYKSSDTFYRFKSDPSMFIFKQGFFHSLENGKMDILEVYNRFTSTISDVLKTGISKGVLLYNDQDIEIYYINTPSFNITKSSKMIVGVNSDVVLFMIGLNDTDNIYTEILKPNEVERLKDKDLIYFDFKILDNIRLKFQLKGSRYKLFDLSVYLI